jgi:hypothetical protein
MEGYEGTNPKATWWPLYSIVGLCVGLLGVVEVGVPAGAVREGLEVLVTLLLFTLMLGWIHVNRLALTLSDEQARSGAAPRAEVYSIPPQCSAGANGSTRFVEVGNGRRALPGTDSRLLRVDLGAREAL